MRSRATYQKFSLVMCAALAACRALIGIDEISSSDPETSNYGEAGSSERSAGASSGGAAVHVPSGNGGHIAQAGTTPSTFPDAGAMNRAGSDAGGGSAGGNGGAGGSQNATWQPSKLDARLVLWLDAGRGVKLESGTAQLVAWADRSSYANHAVAAARANAPIYDTTGPNQTHTIVFDGDFSYLTIAQASGLDWHTDEYLIEIVAAHSTAQYANAPAFGDGALLYAKAYQEPPYSGPGLFGNAMDYNGDKGDFRTALLSRVQHQSYTKIPSRAGVVGNTDGLNDGKFHIFAARRIGIKTLEVRVDGRSDGINTDVEEVNLSAALEPAYLGGIPTHFPYIENGLRGSISEVIAVRGTISDEDVSNVEAYLKQKYGL